MPDPYTNLINSVLRPNSAGYDVGDDELGFGLGADDIGEELAEMGYDVGAIARGGPQARQIIRKAARRALRKRVPDKFDNVYSGAAREAGSAIPEMTVGYSAQTLATGVTFTFTFNANQACVLTGINMNQMAAGKATAGTQLFNCQLSISGQPVGGYPYFGPTRFTSDSFNRRLEPVEISTSVPITFTATTVVASGSVLFEVEIMATRIVSGLSFATRE
jgi:hypothetical protein